MALHSFLLYWFALVAYIALGADSSAPTLNTSLVEECNFTSSAFKPDVMEQIQELFKKEVVRQRYLGESPKYAATSCAEIEEIRPCILPGVYWVEDGDRNRDGATTTNCTVSDEPASGSGIQPGQWRNIANVDMMTHTQCPAGLELYTETTTWKRLCRSPNYNGGCSSTIFSVSRTQYSSVRGRLVGYQFGSTNAFAESSRILETIYVDGVSISYGSPRNHIWTFAAGIGELTSSSSNCPCVHSGASTPPSFVGEDYYCDNGYLGKSWTATFYIENPLWDGEGCGPTSNCCDDPDLPWFTKELPQPTTDDIELRICRNQNQNNEDILLEVVELYIK